MTKQTIIGRVAQLARVDITALLDQAESPQQTTDRLVRAYTDTIQEAEDAVAGTIGSLRMTQHDHAEDVAAAAEWGGRAAAASSKADELRSGGAGAEADRFDHLARVALGRQLRAEKEAGAAEPVIAAQSEVVDRLRAGLERMKERLRQLRAERDESVTRSRGTHRHAHGRKAAPDAVGSVDVMDPTSDMGRFEEKVRREEERAAGRRELGASSLDAQFETLDTAVDPAEIDARLARLKSGAAQAGA